jgi:hypothetical protein
MRTKYNAWDRDSYEGSSGEARWMWRQTGVLRRVVNMVNHSLNFVGSPLKHRGRLMESSFLLSEDVVMEATLAAWISALVATEAAWEETMVKESATEAKPLD